MIGWNSYLRLYYIRLDPFLTLQSNNLYSEDASAFPGAIRCLNGAKPDSASSIKPRSNYEEFFSVSDPPAPVRYFMIYRRISEIQPTSSERAASLLREYRPLFNMLPLRRRAMSLDNILTFVTYVFLD